MRCVADFCQGVSGSPSKGDVKLKVANDNNATYRLTFDDAVDIWLQHWAGRFQHHIAADYRCNAGRINEVLKEKRHVGSKQVAEKKRKASA
jgi:hypothetical protein